MSPAKPNKWFKSFASLTAGPAKAGPLTKRYAAKPKTEPDDSQEKSTICW